MNVSKCREKQSKVCNFVFDLLKIVKFFYFFFLILEACNCNSRLWAFLGAFLIVRAHVALYKIERCKDALMEALEWASLLKNEKLVNFVETVLTINDDYLDLKRKSRSVDTFRKKSLSRATVNLFGSSDEEKGSQTIFTEVSQRTLV